MAVTSPRISSTPAYGDEPSGAVEFVERETVELMGLGFATVSERDTIEHVIGELSHGRGGWLCTVNVDILRQWVRKPEVRELVDEADMIVADGTPLVWASALQGTPLPERVAGSALTFSLTEAAARAGASVFLLGGNPGMADAAARRLTESNPDLKIAGTLCPPFGFERRPEWTERILSELRRTSPDIVYVGLPCPKQERLIRALRPALPQAWFLGCGVSFSYVAGEIKRPPVLLQRLGLEWLCRLVQEPRRLYRRYLVDGVPFMFALMWESLVLGEARRLRRRGADPLPIER